MDDRFFERPILNSPYAYPARHWELDAQGQPTGQIIETRRTAQFITPIPKPKKHKRRAGQERLVFDEGRASRPPSRNTTRRRSSMSCATV
jgi:type III restriction enzyme